MNEVLTIINNRAGGCHLNCVTATYNKMYLEIVFIIKVE